MSSRNGEIILFSLVVLCGLAIIGVVAYAVINLSVPGWFPSILDHIIYYGFMTSLFVCGVVTIAVEVLSIPHLIKNDDRLTIHEKA